MSMHSMFIVFVFVVIPVFCFTDSAFAYLDPGSGSMMLQLLFGGIAGVAVIIKLYWKSFTSLFRRNSGRDETVIHKNESNE